MNGVRDVLSPRTRLLIWMLVVLVPGFALTGFVTRMYHHNEDRLAVEWAARGEDAAQRGRSAEAVDAYLNALRFDPGNAAHTYSLARALVDAGRLAEARAHLLTLWDREPGSGPVNLQLGRLAAREGDTREALRYYHNAIEGSWHEQAEQQRRDARLELARYLIPRGQHAQAQAELLPLIGDLPRDAALARSVGELLLQARAPDRARDVFENALAAAPEDAGLLSAAGHAAFVAADYPAARRYLSRASTVGELDAQLRNMLEISAAVLDLDPLQRRLSSAARMRRARLILARTAERLEACAAQGGPAATDLKGLSVEATTLQKVLTPARARRNPDLPEEALDLAYRGELAAHASCPAREPIDEAIVIFGQRGRP